MKLFGFSPVQATSQSTRSRARRAGGLGCSMAVAVSLFAGTAPSTAQAVSIGPDSNPAPDLSGPALLEAPSSSLEPSHKGLGPKVAVPPWAKGEHIHFFGDQNTTSSSASSEAKPGGGGGKVHHNLGRRCEAGYCPEPPLLYHAGKGVQHSPVVHVIFWGSNWNKAPGSEVKTQLLKMYEGLSGSAWQGILTQYFDSTGRISSTVTVNSYVDTETAGAAPTSVNDAKLREEVTSAVKAKGWIREFGSQFVVIPAPGSTYEKAFSEGGFCGYHGVDGSGSSYTFVAYPGEEPFKKGCIGFDTKENVGNVTSMIASHEYAESATDPQVEPFENAEWYTSNEYEIADICASGDDELSNGTWVQGLWDDHLGECSLSDASPPHVYAVTEPASGVKTREATLRGTINPEGLETKYYFEYGLTTSYGTKTTEVSVGSGTTNKEASQAISGLKLETVYHYRVLATNSTGTTAGEDHTFTTSLWVNQTTPHPEGSEASVLQDVSCTSNTECIAVGLNDAPLGFQSLAERWNGTEWLIQTVPNPKEKQISELTGVSCLSSVSCTAVGWDGATGGANTTLAERWNGTEWSPQTTPSPKGAEFSQLEDVSCTSSTSCMAVGIFGNPLTMIAESWNGTEWTTQSPPIPVGAKQTRLYGVYCTSSTACTAVGAYENSSGFYGSLIEQWNGTAWSQQEAPNPTGASWAALDGVSCSAASACTAVGSFESSSLNEEVAFAERWNGTTWSVQEPPSPNGGVAGSQLFSVSCPSSTACTAVGTYKTSAHLAIPIHSAPLIDAWNGSGWHYEIAVNPIAGGKTGLNNLYGASCSALAHCAAVGEYQEAFGPETMLATIRAAFKPVVETKSATGMKETEATLNGSVNPEGSETTYYFEYGETTSYGSKTGEFSAGYGTSNVEESKTVTGLLPSKTYHFRIVASNGGGTANGADKTFSTTGKPTVETKAATSVGETGATLNGTVNPRGSETKYYFEYGLTTSYGTKTAETSAGSGTTTLEESKAISGLTAGTTYHFRIVATNSHGTAEGGDKTFATPSKPTVETKAATSVGETGATLNGTVNPRGSETKYYFEYGLTTSYGTKTAETSAGSGTTTLEESKAISGLTAGTEYHFRIVATNANGTSNGADKVLSTPSKPVVETKAATTVRALEATLNGTVNPEKSETTYHFEYGKTISYGTSVPVPSGNVGSGSTAVEEHKTIAGLEAGTIYHFRIVATNGTGTSNGADKTFTTLSSPSWRITSTPNPTGQKGSRLNKVSCTTSTTCTAVGDYVSSTGTLKTLAETWNSEEWKEQTTPNPSGAPESELVGVSCTSSAACMAVGSYVNGSGVAVPLAESWNGTSWSIQEPLAPAEAKGSGLFDVSCTSSTACTAVGAYESSTGAFLMLAESWNGTSWSIKETPAPTGTTVSQLVGVSCTSSSACTAVGEFVSSGKWRPLAETWNGTAWSAQELVIPTEGTLPFLEGVSCTSSSACEAVGSYNSSHEGTLVLAERWNGTAWSLQSTPKPSGSGLSKLLGVSCTSSTSCTGVGYYSTELAGEVTLGEHWNGTEWSILATSNPAGASRLLGVSCLSSTPCAGVGYYFKSKGEENIVTLAELYG